LASSAFGLNSEGYTEDQTIQLTGGTHNLVGNYSGDNSYDASSGTDAVTVTTAPTTTTVAPPGRVNVGASFFLTVTTQAQSSGVVPTGTFTIFDGGKQIESGGAGGGFHSSADEVAIEDEIPIALSAPSGSHTLTVQYSGDNNYAASTSPAVMADVVYPVAMSATATPNSVVYGSGTSVTVTATVDTTNPTSNVALKPTGSFSFSGPSGPINGPVTVNTAQDPSGNWELIASTTFVPQRTETIYVTYSGDSNYAEYPNANATVTVIIPDFSVSAGSSPLVITAGQTGTTTITVTPTTNDSSTVQISCATVFPGGSCTSSPTSVSLSNGTAATTMVTISTLAPSTSTTTGSASMAVRRSAMIPFHRGPWWTLSLLAGLVALFLAVVPGRQKSREAALGMALVCVLSFAIGCGGGANASGGGGGGTGQAFTTTTTLSASATKAPEGTSVTLTATVQSSAPNPPTGSVTFTAANCEYSQFANLTNGSGQLQFLGGPVPVGTCTVTAQYGGDANNLASMSGALNIAFTGTTQAQVTGQTGTDVHTTTVTITIQ
jgi:large repetitive protein